LQQLTTKLSTTTIIEEVWLTAHDQVEPQ